MVREVVDASFVFFVYVADMHGCDVAYHEQMYGERPVLYCGEIDVGLSMTWDERSVRYVVAISTASIGLIDVLVNAAE